MRPNAETPRSRRRRHTAPPTEASKEHHESEVAAIEAGLKLLEVYTTALKEVKERGQEGAGDIKLALDVRHAPRDWSNAEILSVMSDIIDEHPKPKLEFVLGVLGLSKLPDSLDERLRSKGAKAYASGVRNRALRRKKEAKEKEERERREKKEREEREKREKREKKEREEKERREKKRIEKERLEKERLEKQRLEKERLEKERLEKERLEKERLEKERLEKERLEKERLEKERLEKERLEKERLEKERIEKERIEKEHAEKKERDAALRMEAEGQKGHAKGRKGGRLRPPTRAVATERARKIDADQDVSSPTVLVEGAVDNLQKVDAMEVDNDDLKQIVILEGMSNKDPNADAMQQDIIADRPKVATERVKSQQKEDVPTTPSPNLPSPPLSRQKPNAIPQNVKSVKATEQRASGPSKEEYSLPKDEAKTEPDSDTAAKHTADQKTLQVNVTEKRGKSAVKSEKQEGYSDLEMEKSAIEIRESRAPDASSHPEEPIMDTSGRPAVVQRGKQEVRKPASPAIAVREEPVVAGEQMEQPTVVPVVTPPKAIAEAKIASALKESAAVVNGEINEIHRDPSVTTKARADLDKSSSAVQLQTPREMYAPVSKEAKDRKESVEAEEKPDDVNMTGEDSKSRLRAAKEPIQMKTTLEAQKERPSDIKTANKKGEAIASSKKPIENRKKHPTGAEIAVAEPPKGERGSEVIQEDEKAVVELSDDSKKPSVIRQDSHVSEENDDETKPDEEKTAVDSEEKAKEPEQAAEDFMADVFGPEDGDGEKDDTEEGDTEKRGHRYRFRGRRSNDDNKQTETVAKGKGSSMDESEDDSQTKDKAGPERPKVGARRMSRRVSNIRDEIVIAPAGRRMRRESRNLINGAWHLPNPDQHLLKCVEVWERLHANRISIPFRDPVTAKDAPGYFDVVKNPMDMRTVKDMLQDGRISSPDEFYKQMKLICSNAFVFNDEDSDLFELAMELLEIIRKDTKPIVKSWREAKGLETEDSESESEAESQRKRTKGRPKKKASKAKSKSKSKSTTEKRKRVREDDAGSRNKKRRTLRRSARRDDDE